jgi:hypothetical protein
MILARGSQAHVAIHLVEVSVLALSDHHEADHATGLEIAETTSCLHLLVQQTTLPVAAMNCSQARLAMLHQSQLMADSITPNLDLSQILTMGGSMLQLPMIHLLLVHEADQQDQADLAGPV